MLYLNLLGVIAALVTALSLLALTLRATWGESVSTSVFDFLVRAYVVLSFVNTGIYFLTVWPWCAWQENAARNIRALGARNLQFSPGWSIGVYFIPIVNWYRPYQAMCEIYANSQPRKSRNSYSLNFGDPASVVNSWWLLYLIGWLSGVALVVYAFFRRLPSPEEVYLIAIGLHAVFVIHCLVAVRMIRIINKMQLDGMHKVRAHSIVESVESAILPIEES